MLVSRNLIVALLGAGLLALGAFLPWITATIPLAGTINRSGLDGGGDGILVLIIAVVGGLGALTGTRAGGLVAALAGVGGILLGVIDYGSVQAKVTDPKLAQYATTGAGIYVVVLGAILLAIGGMALFSEAKAKAKVGAKLLETPA